MLYIDMNEAQVVLMELTLSTDGMKFGCRRATVKPFGPEDTPDAVAVEVGAGSAGHEGQIIEAEAR